MFRFSTLLCAVLVPSLAWGTNYMDRDTHKRTDISGVEGGPVARAIPEDKGALALIGVSIYGSSQGQTCGLAGSVGPLTGREDTKQTAESLFVLKSGVVVDHANLNDRLKADCGKPIGLERIRKEGNYFVRGVTVCTNSGNTADRTIQGMRVWYSKLKQNGTLEKVDGSELWTGGSCQKWEDRVMCPVGMLAVGLRAQTGAAGVRALGLKCAEVKQRGN